MNLSQGENITYTMEYYIGHVTLLADTVMDQERRLTINVSNANLGMAITPLRIYLRNAIKHPTPLITMFIPLSYMTKDPFYYYFTTI